MTCHYPILQTILPYLRPKKVCDISTMSIKYTHFLCSALLAPSFSTHKRINSLPVITRPRAQSQASLPRSRGQPSSPAISNNQNRAPQPISPLQSRRAISSLNQSLNLMSTPPPNRALARQLKLKGSVTDPAQPRRREAFGSVSIVD